MIEHFPKLPKKLAEGQKTCYKRNIKGIINQLLH